jgi:FAD synthase
MKIHKEIISRCYYYAKKVYHKQIDKTTATNNLYKEVGMNQGSAGDYIEAFCSMMNGERYTRTINTEATKYYLDNIKNDYGYDQLKTAINAVKLHTKYYGGLGRGHLRSIEKVADEYMQNIG